MNENIPESHPVAQAQASDRAQRLIESQAEAQKRVPKHLRNGGGDTVTPYKVNTVTGATELNDLMELIFPPERHEAAKAECLTWKAEQLRTFIYEAGLGQGIEVSQIPDIYDVSETPWPHIKMAFVGVKAQTGQAAPDDD